MPEYLDASTPPLPSNVDIMISLARIDEKMRGLSDAKRTDHDVMTRDITRVEMESRQRDMDLSTHMTKLDDAVSSLKLSWAKAAGMAAVVAGIIGSVISLAIAYLVP